MLEEEEKKEKKTEEKKTDTGGSIAADVLVRPMLLQGREMTSHTHTTTVVNYSCVTDTSKEMYDDHPLFNTATRLFQCRNIAMSLFLFFQKQLRFRLNELTVCRRGSGCRQPLGKSVAVTIKTFHRTSQRPISPEFARCSD